MVILTKKGQKVSKKKFFLTFRAKINAEFVPDFAKKKVQTNSALIPEKKHGGGYMPPKNDFQTNSALIFFRPKSAFFTFLKNRKYRQNRQK